MLREYAAGASGAVLGYISGDIPGAYYGYKLAKKLTQKEMPPIKRKRVSTVMAGTKRRKVTALVSKNYGVRKMRNVLAATGGWKGTTLRKGKKKKQKKVKVSKKLREKIKKVVTGEKPKGYFQEVAYDDLKLNANDDNKQTVIEITSFTGGIGDALFSPARVMDAASVLWNEKDQLRTGKTIFDAENFDRNKCKIKVIKSSVTYNMKNNTQRVINLKLIECEPKSNQVPTNALTAWTQEMAYQATLDGANQASATTTEIHIHPSILPAFTRMFKTRTSEYKLQPGQEISHKVVGPSDKVYDYTKFWNGTSYLQHCVGSKFVLAVYYVDMVSLTTTGLSPDTVQGRYMAIVPTNDLKWAILVEGVHRYELEMPDQTGFIGPVTTAPDANPLDQRQFSYAFKTYPSDIQTGSGSTTTIQSIIQTEAGTYTNPLPGV